MESSNSQINYLWQQYVANRATPAELDQLFSLLEDPAQDEEHFQIFREALAKRKQDMYLSHSSKTMMWDNIINSTQIAPESTNLADIRPARRTIAIRRWAAAASVLAIVAAGAYLWQQQQPKPPVKIVSNTKVVPGKEGAILTLADGSEVSVDSTTGTIQQGGASVKLVNGALVYKAAGKEVVYNKMSTPKGRQFKLALPDGSIVWLNAESAIRYPTVFAGNERRVEITGEAYLEIAPDAKMPFRVNVADKTTVDVLGTAFNINAYPNETNIKTTLISGAVKVTANNNQLILQPGQQAQVTQNNGKMELVKNANISQVVAWKNGFFNFEDVTLAELMLQLERWYDITVEYENGVPDITFGGKMSRQESLESLLKGLEESGVRFRLQGRKVIVINNNKQPK